MQQPEFESISEEILHLESIAQRGERRLRLPGALEAQFQQYYAEVFKSYRRSSMLVALLAIGMVGLLDLVVFAEQWRLIAPIRYGLGVPFVAIISALMFSPWFERCQQQIITLSCLFVSLVATTLLLLGPPQAIALYLAAYLLIAFFAGTIVRLAFNRAILIMVVTAVGFNLLLFWWRPQGIDIIASYNAYFTCGALMSLAANYAMELSVRREFLQQKLLGLERVQLEQANTQLEHMATIDPLTGVNNRRQMEKVLDAEWRRASRSHTCLSVLMVDIDHFKKYNDGYGHQAGDVCLVQVAECIANSFRRSLDTVARYGGEEFVVVLPDTGAEQAQQLAATLCANVRELHIEHAFTDTAHREVSLSVGVARAWPGAGSDYTALLRCADKALYQAKERGRNRVAVYADSLDASPV